MLFGRNNESPENAELEMGFFEHLEELRMRLLLSILAILVCSVLGFVYAREIIAFLMVPLRRAMSGLPLPAQLHYTSLTEPLFQSFKIALFAGLMLAFPYWIWQAWRFIAPGLLDKEKRLAAPILLSATGLFVAGVSFAYIIAVPTAYRFLLMYASAPPVASKAGAQEGLMLEWSPQKTSAKKRSAKPTKGSLQLRVTSSPAGTQKRWKLHLKTRTHKSPRALLSALMRQKSLDVLVEDGGKKRRFTLGYRWKVPMGKKGSLTPILTLKEYLGVSTWFLFGFGLVFQTPMVIFLLSVIGLLSPYTLSKYRRHAFVGILIIASVLTPTGDPINLMIMAVPMYILFEIGLLVSKIFVGPPDDDGEDPPPGGGGGSLPPKDPPDAPLDPEDTWSAYQAQLDADLSEESLGVDLSQGVEVPPEDLLEDPDTAPAESESLDSSLTQTQDSEEASPGDTGDASQGEAAESTPLSSEPPEEVPAAATAPQEGALTPTDDEQGTQPPSAERSPLPAQEEEDEEDEGFLPPALRGWGQSIGGISGAAGKRPQILPPQGDVYRSPESEPVQEEGDKEESSTQSSGELRAPSATTSTEEHQPTSAEPTPSEPEES